MVWYRLISYVLWCAFVAPHEALLGSSEWYVSLTTFESWSTGSRLRPGHCFGQLCLALAVRHHCFWLHNSFITHTIFHIISYNYISSCFIDASLGKSPSLYQNHALILLYSIFWLFLWCILMHCTLVFAGFGNMLLLLKSAWLCTQSLLINCFLDLDQGSPPSCDCRRI